MWKGGVSYIFNSPEVIAHRPKDVAAGVVGVDVALVSSFAAHEQNFTTGKIIIIRLSLFWSC